MPRMRRASGMRMAGMSAAFMPVFVVEGANDGETPLMRIVQMCPACETEVSNRVIDVSQMPDAVDEAEADARAWLAHLAERHS